MGLRTPIFISLAFLLLASCNSDTHPRRPALGEAFIGPITIHIRTELNPKSPVVATLAHGDRVEVLEQRRIFVRVRTADGHEGWTEARQLMTKEQMSELRGLAEEALALPSQGAATSYEPVNVHTAPDRNSPSFFQFREGTKVDVLAHKVTPRLPRSSVPATRLIPPRPKPAKRAASDDSDGRRRLRPPPAPAPGLPSNWRELSETDETDLGPPIPAPAATPPPLEDWSLVRTPDGAAGWVLTRLLVMSIPDEVAQYSEGNRIAAYFPMNEVRDGDKVKYDWLWATQSKTEVPYDFDSFRYFVYNPRHHRYETGYIQHNVVGHYPITVKPGTPPRFSMILEDAAGKLYRYNFVLQGYHMRLEKKEPWTEPALGAISATPRIEAQTAEAPPARPGLLDRIRHWFRK
jgi:hypothetical protein